MADVSSDLSPAALARYSRQLQLAEIGEAGQRRLAASRVLVIGAGGLGSPAALYLAAAGVGVLGLADFDVVEEHNLHRQLLHDTSSVGRPKVASAAARLTALNPQVQVVTHPQGVTTENAVSLFEQYDVIVDGTDNFTARYRNNDAAFLTGRPLVYGSVYKFEGSVAVFAPQRGGPCYRCLFPQPPAPDSVPGCGEAGVLGALCGVIGSWQALETLKLLVGFGEPLIGRLLTYDALRQTFATLTLTPDPACPLCGSRPTIRGLAAGSGGSDGKPRAATVRDEIDVREAHQLLATAGAAVELIDVREPWELGICQLPGARHIPLGQLTERVAEIPRDRRLLVLCHHGSRSRQATAWLRAQGFADAFNIAGGIAAWAEVLDPQLRRY
jgi:adenylyltransferase/sulfurtransferase